MLQRFRERETKKNIELNIQRRIIRRILVTMTMQKIVAHYGQMVLHEQREATYRQRLYQYTLMVWVKIKMKLKKKGPSLDERTRASIRRQITLTGVSFANNFTDGARETLRKFLFDRMKIQQLRIKMVNYYCRIVNIQQRARIYLAKKIEYQTILTEKLDFGFGALQKYLTSNKKFKTQCKELIQTLSSIPYETKARAVKFHLVLSSYVHTVQLLRWYGMFKNDGEYNKDLYFAIHDQLKVYLSKRNDLAKAVKALGHPTEEQLDKSNKDLKQLQDKMNNKKKPMSIKSKLDNQLLLKDKEDLQEVTHPDRCKLVESVEHVKSSVSTVLISLMQKKTICLP